MMRKAVLTATVGAAALAFGVAACSSSSSPSSSPSGGSNNAAKPKVGVIMPESGTTSARWVNADTPAIQAECVKKNLDCDVQNANASTDTEKTIADKMINVNKVQVLILCSIDAATAKGIVTEAHAAGVKVIDYDRLNVGAGSDYYISFDNTKVGSLQGNALVSAVTAAKVTNPTVAVLNGSTTDNNAKLFNTGYMGIINPLITAGTWKKASEQWIDKWTDSIAGTTFSTMYNSNKNINVVMVANDGMADAVISDLKNLGINGKVVVSGQDATAVGLQHIMDGDQAFSIYKPVAQEAVPAVDLAAELAAGTTPAETFSDVTDTALNKPIKSLLATPLVITKENINLPIKGGDVKYADVCTSAYVAKCTAAGITQ
jgi:D-xylose transport system substrate-binding protein